jgi:hypothetical protein
MEDPTSENAPPTARPRLAAFACGTNHPSVHGVRSSLAGICIQHGDRLRGVDGIEGITTVPDIVNQLDDRIVGAQAWFIASELIRRHPKLKLIETHPHWGVHDCLTVCAVDGPHPEAIIELARSKFIWVRAAADQDRAHIEWLDTLKVEASTGKDDPQHAIKRIEKLAGLVPPAKTPASIPSTLTYRTAAGILASLVNDKHRWDVRNEFFDGDDSTLGSERRHWTDAFPSAASAIEQRRPDDLLGNPAYRYWALLRADAPVAILDTDGLVHLHNATHSLPELYRNAN